MRDFTNERLTHHVDTERLFCDGSGERLLYVRPATHVFLSEEEERGLLNGLLACFNACRDALAVLERKPGHITDVEAARHILRKGEIRFHELLLR